MGDNGSTEDNAVIYDIYIYIKLYIYMCVYIYIFIVNAFVVFMYPYNCNLPPECVSLGGGDPLQCKDTCAWTQKSTD